MAKCGDDNRDMGVCNQPAGHEGDHMETGPAADDGSPSFSSWPQDDGGGNEGPSFESSMRAKFPVQPSPAAMPHWSSTFNDRRKGR